MIIKSLVVGLLLSASLLVLGMAVGKTLAAVLFAVLLIPLSLLSPAVAFIAYVALAVLILALPTELFGSTGGKSASGTGSYRITALSGPLRGRGYTLSARKPSLDFGREKCKVLFPANTSGVSRHHCRVFLKEGRAYIVDNGSQYGTYLLPTGHRLSPGSPERLENGQRFCLAHKEIMFEINRN